MDITKELIKKTLNSIIFRHRTGELTITFSARMKMEQFGITDADIKDAWRYGKEDLFIPEKIIRDYPTYRVALVVKKRDEENILISCWKYNK